MKLEPERSDHLSYGEMRQLVASWEEAGRPDDVMAFMASTSPWKHMPMNLIFASLTQHTDVLPEDHDEG